MSDNPISIKLQADIKDFIKGLYDAEKATQGFGKSTQKNISGANVALTNLSRVAQDAPFGFIAIQNNISPLLESFQQLRVETGSTGGAFKAIGAQLLGPVGLLVGFSVVSSAVTALIQKYGSLSNAAEALFTGNGKLIERQQQLIKFQDGLSNSVSGEISKIFILVQAYKAWEGQTEKQDAVLKKLSQSSDIFKKEIDGQVVSYDKLVKANEAYLKSLLGRIVIETQQEQIRQLAKEYTDELVNLQRQEEKNAKAAQKKRDATKNELDLLTNLSKAQQNLNGDIINAAPKVEKSLLTTAEATQVLINKFLQAAGKITSGSDKIISQLGLVDLGIKTVNNNKPIEIFAPLKGTLQTVEQTTTAFKDYINTLNVIPKAAQGLRITKELQAGLNAETANAVEISKFYTEQYKQAAQIITSFLSPAIDGFFSSIENGQNAFQALGNALKGLIIDIVKTVAKAAILAAILNIIFPTGSTGATRLGNASGGFGGFFSQFLGLPNLGGTAAPSIGSAGGLSGGLQLAGNVVFVQRGYDLVGVLNASNGSINNVG